MIFETNSSSVHAIYIANTFPEDSAISKGTLQFKNESFQTEQKIYRDVQSKTNYLYGALLDVADGDVEKEKEYLDKLKSELDILGITYEFEPVTGDWWYGHIDHGKNCKEFLEAVLNDSDKLMRYLFNGSSQIRVAYDNDYDWTDFVYEKTEETRDAEMYIKYN